MLTKKNALAGLLLAVISVVSVPLYATQIDPLSWEQMAVACDFAGIVECTTAGGIVAEYKVIDAWKGAPQKEKIRIRVATNYWEPQFPLALVGEQYLVFAYKNNTGSRVVSTTMGGPVPLWWRNIDHDYRLPLFQGRYKPDSNRQLKSYDLSHSGDTSKTVSIDDFKKQVKELVGKTKQQQEMVLLKILFKKYFIDRHSQSYKSDLDMLNSYKNAIDADKHQEYIRTMEAKVKAHEQAADDIKKLSRQVQSVTEPAMIIEKVIDFTLAHGDYKYSLRSLLQQAIQTPKSLEHLNNQIQASKSKQQLELPKYVLDQIEKRVNSGPDKPYARPDQPQKTYTAKELDAHQEILTDPEKKKDYKWSQSFQILIEHRPLFAARWLAGWKNKSKEWRHAHRGYELGSFFAFRCKKDRTECLKKLLKAKDDYVRTAAAVYLAFEDEKLGLKQLRKMRKLKKEPGLWASLNLARRGSKDDMDDVIKEFSDYPYRDGSGMVQVPHRNLLKRAEVLLSNSAAKSNTPKPPRVTHLRKYNPGDEIKIQKAVNDLQVWWAKNKKQIKLHDPWFQTLKKQKVD